MTDMVFPLLTSAGMAHGQLFYWDGSPSVDEFQRLAVSTDGKILTTVSGAPAWVTQDTVKYLDSTYSCKVRKGATFSVDHATTTVLTFTGAEEIWDGNTYHDASTNTERLTVQDGADGIYRIEAHGRWATNATGIRLFLVYVKNSGGTTLELIGDGPHDGDATYNRYHSVGALLDLNAGDYVEIQLRQTSGGALLFDSLATLSLVRLAEAQ